MGFPAMTIPEGAAPQAGGGGDAVSMASARINEMMQKMMSQLARPRSSLAQPVPSVDPQQMRAHAGQYQMGRQGSGMGEVGAFLNNIGVGINNAVAGHKEKQIRAAMADYAGLQAAWESAEMVAQGDPDKARKMFEADPRTQGILGDPKKMKNMAKAFSMDLLKPEKTTVYGDALKRHLQADKAGKMVKALRAMGMARKQQPQLSPEDKQKMVHENAGKLPITQQPQDAEKWAGLVQKQQELEMKHQEALARATEMHERTQQMMTHNQEMIEVYRERLQDQKLDREQKAQLSKFMADLQAEALQLKRFQVLVDAAKEK